MDRTFCCIAENREGEEDEGESSSREEGLLKYGRGIVEEILLHKQLCPKVPPESDWEHQIVSGDYLTAWKTARVLIERETAPLYQMPGLPA